MQKNKTMGAGVGSEAGQQYGVLQLANPDLTPSILYDPHAHQKWSLSTETTVSPKY